MTERSRRDIESRRELFRCLGLSRHHRQLIPYMSFEKWKNRPRMIRNCDDFQKLKRTALPGEAVPIDLAAWKAWIDGSLSLGQEELETYRRHLAPREKS